MQQWSLTSELNNKRLGRTWCQKLTHFSSIPEQKHKKLNKPYLKVKTENSSENTCTYKNISHIKTKRPYGNTALHELAISLIRTIKNVFQYFLSLMGAHTDQRSQSGYTS